MGKSEQQLTRRKFLKTAASATAAAALPRAGAVTGSYHSNDAVRYGFIGTGTQGCTLLRFLATIPEGRRVATCDLPPNLGYPALLRRKSGVGLERHQQPLRSRCTTCRVRMADSTADALSTAFFVMDVHSAQNYISTHGNLGLPAPK